MQLLNLDPRCDKRMKVLILRGTTKEVNNDPGWYFHLTLEERGIEHDMICHDALGNNSIVAKGINYAARRFKKRQSPGLINRYRNADRTVLCKVKQLKPDLIMVMGGKTIKPALIREIRAMSRNIMIVNCFWDNPFLYDISFSCIPEYDVFFVKDSFVLNELKKIGGENVRYLPEACYPKEHRPLDDITEEERRKYSSELSIVGSLYPYRVYMFEALRGRQLKVWGRGRWGITPENEYALNSYQDESVDGRRKVLVFNLTMVNLNTLNPLNCIYGLNSRIHHIAACGGFQLMEYNPDLEKQYDVGSEIIAFRSRDELRELAEYYLSHPEGRLEIAERARQRALKEHTFDHRLDEILNIISLS